jgi:uncharacterized protein (TIGR02145 family)
MKTITIGNQIWTAENLNVNCFNNGDELLHATTDLDWKKAAENQTPAWCFYENNIENSPEYGRLYNWYAVNDSRGITPEGFCIPTNDHFKELIAFLSNDAGQKLKSKNGWLEYGKGGGTDEFNFNAKPGGENNFNYPNNPRGSELLYGKAIKEKAWFWSSSNADDNSELWAIAYCLSCWNNEMRQFTSQKNMGFSVRCIGL